MTAHHVDLVLDPYDYDFHEDPYPYYRRLRDEAPLYRNDDLGFWALTRHADVHRGFRNSTALSNKLGVSLDPISRTPRPTGPCRSWPWTIPAHLRLRTLVSRGFTPRRVRELEARVLELAREHLDAALAVRGFRLHRRVRRQASDGCHLRARSGCRSPTASTCARWPTT